MRNIISISCILSGVITLTFTFYIAEKLNKWYDIHPLVFPICIGLILFGTITYDNEVK